MGNIIARRLVSISDYLENTNPDYIQNTLNILLTYIPDIIPLAPIFPHLYLEGGLHKSIYVKPHDFVELDFDISLQDDNHPLTDLNLANFSST